MMMMIHNTNNIVIWCQRPNSLVGRVFSSGPGDRGSSPGRVIPKTQKIVLDISLLNTQHEKVRVKRKVEQSREKEVVPSPKSRCSSYWKVSVRVALDYSRYSYLIILNRSIWPKDRTPTGIPTLSQSGSRSNGNKRVLNNSKSTRIGATLPDSRHFLFLRGGYPSAGDSVRAF